MDFILPTGTKAALFDLDGTLMDTEQYYTRFWDEIAADYFPGVTNLADNIRGITPSITMQRLFPDEAVRKEVTERMDEFDRHIPYRFFDGAVRFIKSLRKEGILCAVVTSSQKLKMDCVYKAIPEFKGLFDLILTAEEFGNPKPAPDCYLKAAQRLGLPPSECVVFEDSDAGLQAARSAGIYTYGVAVCSPSERLEGKCDCIIHDFTRI